MTRSLLSGLIAGTLLLTACNDPNKTNSTMTTDDTSYPSGRSDTSTGTTPTTYPPTYTTTMTTPPASDSSTSYTTTPPSSYNTTATSPPVTTTITPANSSNTEMSGDESLSPGSSKRTKARSTGSESTYTVKSGDNLSKIAKKVYGDSNKWNRIYNANKGKISNPNQLKVGTKLVIP